MQVFFLPDFIHQAIPFASFDSSFEGCQHPWRPHRTGFRCQPLGRLWRSIPGLFSPFGHFRRCPWVRCFAHVLHLSTALRSRGFPALLRYYGGCDSCAAPLQHRRRSHSFSHDVVLLSCSSQTRSSVAGSALGCAVCPPRRSPFDDRLRHFSADSPPAARRIGFNTVGTASFGPENSHPAASHPASRQRSRLQVPVVPHHHRTWTFTSYRHDLGLARSAAVLCRFSQHGDAQAGG